VLLDCLQQGFDEVLETASPVPHLPDMEASSC